LLARYQEEKRAAKIDEKTIREGDDRKCFGMREMFQGPFRLITVDK
jgi:hypothetical protein